jgi:hypothetical protein
VLSKYTSLLFYSYKLLAQNVHEIYASGQHKTFLGRNLRCFCRIALSFDSGNADMSVNYAEKSFMKLTPAADAMKLF